MSQSSKLTLWGRKGAEELTIDFSVPDKALVAMYDSWSGASFCLSVEQLKTLHSWLGMVLQDVEQE